MSSLSARAFFAAVALAALPTAAPGADVTPAVPDREVRVERSGGSFTVDLLAHVPVSASQAWAVLTDFEHMAEFIPNVTSSQVLERSEFFVRVSQKGTARYGIFKADFDSLREIRLMPTREIRAHGVGGNIKRMESVMQLEPEAGGTRLQYHAEVQPEFWMPPLIGPAIVRHETAEQFSAIIDEMIRRR
jgi:carbon monoxide dehydrogenase subunit G